MTTIRVAQATVTVTGRRNTTAYVRIAGEIDMAIEAALGDAIDRLVALAPHTVEVDLTAVTLSGVNLANFFAHMDGVIPDGATIVAHGATPSVRRVLDLTGISELVHLREDVTRATNAAEGMTRRTRR